jgi:hypothetical protein
MNISRIAAALGRCGKGKRKTLTPAQRRAQRRRLAAIRHLRWAKPQNARLVKPVDTPLDT